MLKCTLTPGDSTPIASSSRLRRCCRGLLFGRFRDAMEHDLRNPILKPKFYTPLVAASLTESFRWRMAGAIAKVESLLPIC